MSNGGYKPFLIYLALIIAPLAPAQNPLASLFTLGAGNVAEIKQAAEMGDSRAQVRLAGLLAGNFRSAEALDWYRKAAYMGNIEAAYQVGHMLLFGATGNNPQQGVKSEPTEGVVWMFLTATNGYTDAYHDMSIAYQRGLGVSPDPILAYAWLQLYTDSINGLVTTRVELNQMALNLDTRSIRSAEGLAANFKAGNWQQPVIVTPPQEPTLTAPRPRTIAEALAIEAGKMGSVVKTSEVLASLKLSGIASGGNGSSAVINGKILSEGESAEIPTKSGTLKVKCLKIETRSVQIMVEGEDGPRTLSIK